jgi:hypothetical protein
MTGFLHHAACLSAILAMTTSVWSQIAPTEQTFHPDAWTIQQPYPNNPLRQATISGSVAIAGEARPAQLQIECRAPELARLNLLFHAPGLKFNLDPFEGPPWIGQKRKLLQIQLDAHPPSAYFFNGFYVESNTFVFAVAPPREDLRRIVSSDAATKSIQVQVLPADRKGDPLQFTFTLPAANAPALDVAKPCIDSKAKNREPDPR